MKYFYNIIFVFYSLTGAAALDTKRCLPELPGEIPVYSSDYKWDLTLDEITDIAISMYRSEKRLAQRAYYDRSMKSFVFPEGESLGGKVRIPEQFAKTIVKHVEKAFERGYVDALIFPDMGHSHFLVPMDFYKQEIEPLPLSQFNFIYQKIMQNKDVKVVYHTAEQLRFMDENKKLIDDKKLQWRFYTRNLVGHNTPEPDLEIFNATAENSANTMGEIRGYRWWGGGFNIHANKKGCFEFKRGGKAYYFDLSLRDLQPAPGIDAGAGGD
jgi:hypothetical protein